MKNLSLRITLILIVLTLSSLACQAMLGGSTRSTVQPQPLSTPIVMPLQLDAHSSTNLMTQEELLTTLYERVSPGVVSITNLNDQTVGSQGSGFVIDNEGHIVTNYHVVENAKQLEVAFTNGVKVYGKVVGTDTDSDLAVIKVDVPAGTLVPLTLADSSQVKVGQTVVAIGNPFGLNGTMTIGIVSAKGRTLDSLRTAEGGATFTAGDVIQTDAAINPGNSGGPLLNLKGEVIGVNRAIRTTGITLDGEPANSGIGFAVSSNIVRRVAPALIANGKYDYPYLGISAMPELSLHVQEQLKLPQATGVYVTSVVANGPSAQAGIQPEDLIIRADDRPLGVFADLIGYLFTEKSPGDTVKLTLLRNGREIQVTVTLGKRP
ncbi:MAG: trypsin-like peptidase domain-containing protein [Anaerolineales bacterium]